MSSFYRGTAPTFTFPIQDLQSYDTVLVIFKQGENTLVVEGVADAEGVSCTLTKSQTAGFNTASPASVDVVTQDSGVRIIRRSYSLTVNENHFESLFGGDDAEDLSLTFMEAIQPIGDEDPYLQGWYELSNGEYELTTDRTVDLDKFYYSDPEDLFSFFPTDIGEDSDSVEMVLMDDDELSIPGINPYEEGWYVLAGGVYTSTMDTSVVSGRDYYAAVDDDSFDGDYPDESDEFAESFDGESFIEDNGYGDGDEDDPSTESSEEWDESILFDVSNEIDESVIEFYTATPESDPKAEGFFELISSDESGDPLDEPYYEPTVDTTAQTGKSYYKVRMSA